MNTIINIEINNHCNELSGQTDGHKRDISQGSIVMYVKPQIRPKNTKWVYSNVILIKLTNIYIYNINFIIFKKLKSFPKRKEYA